MSVRFAGPSPHALRPGTIHLWTAALSVSDDVRAKLWTFLSADEQERASRFVFERDRRWSIAARGLLRAALASYVDAAPERLEFVYAERGKPALHARHGASLEFNLSHSGGLAAIAVTQGSPIGVDVEQVRTLDDLDCLARQCFAAGERAQLAELAPAVRHEAFFNCWTRKEAYIKALGEGLSCPLESFEVTLAPGDRAHVRSIDGSEEFARLWWMHTFTPAPGFAGAVVAHGSEYVVNTGWLQAGVAEAAAGEPLFA